MRLPTHKISDAQLRNNPYLALQQSGAIRPGEGEIVADQTAGQASELLGEVMKAKTAQFASEDKTAITDGTNAASKVLLEAKRAAEQGDPSIAETSFAEAVGNYRNSVMKDETLSVIARDGIIDFIDKYEPAYNDTVIGNATVKQGKIEIASLEALSQTNLDAVQGFIREGDPTAGTQAIAQYRLMMVELEKRYMAGVGTAFVSKQHATNAYNAVVKSHTQTLVEDMIATDDPAYKGQIEAILKGSKTENWMGVPTPNGFRVGNWGQLTAAHNQNKADWKREEAGAHREAINNANSAGAEAQPQGMAQAARDAAAMGKAPHLTMNPIQGTSLNAAWNASVYERDNSDGHISAQWTANSAKDSLVQWAENNYRDYSVQELRDIVADAKNHEVFSGAAIEWSGESGVLHAVLNTKVRHTNEAIADFSEALEKIVNDPDVDLSLANIKENAELFIGDEEHLYYDRSRGDFVTYKPNQVRLEAVHVLLRDLANYENIGDKSNTDFWELEKYVKDELKLGTKVNDILRAEESRRQSLTNIEVAKNAAISAVQTKVDMDGDGTPDEVMGFRRHMTESLDNALTSHIDTMFNLGNDVGALQLLDDFAHSGQILKAHSNYYDALLNTGVASDIATAFDFLRQMEAHDPQYVNSILGKSNYEPLGDLDSRETIASLFRYGGRASQDRLQVIIETSPQSLSKISGYSKLVGEVGKGKGGLQTSFADAGADVSKVRKAIDALAGQAEGDGEFWTDIERDKYAPIVAMLIEQRWSGTDPEDELAIQKFIQSDEFAAQFKDIYLGAGVVYTGHGASNQLPYDAIDRGNLNEAQAAAVEADASQNKFVEHVQIPAPNYDAAADASGPQLSTRMTGNIWITQGGPSGVIGTMLAGVKDHRQEAMGDIGNAFFLSPEHVGDIPLFDYEEGEAGQFLATPEIEPEDDAALQQQIQEGLRDSGGRWIGQFSPASRLMLVPIKFQDTITGFAVSEISESGEMQPWQHPLATDGRISVDQDGTLASGELAQMQLELINQASRLSANAPTTLRKTTVQMRDIINLWLHQNYITADTAAQLGAQNAP